MAQNMTIWVLPAKDSGVLPHLKEALVPMVELLNKSD